MTMAVLKRNTTEVLSRFCVYFAARKREQSRLHRVNNISHRPTRAAVPQIDHSLPHDWPGHYAYIAHAHILMNLMIE
jgi:hypothetical protein